MDDKRRSAADLADWLVEQLNGDADVVVPMSNGEPVVLLDEIEARADRLTDVRIHQMHALRDRPYLHGAYRGHLEHVSWFLSHITRQAYADGDCAFAPSNFSEVPQLLLERKPAFLVAAASPPDANGFFSLGTVAAYSAAMIGRVPIVLEVNDRVPRTFGSNRIHISEIEAFCETSYPLLEVPPAEPTALDGCIAELVAERVPHGATIQLGIGGVPTAVANLLSDHKDLAIHTELFSDPMVDLIRSGAVTGLHKRRYRSRSVTTFALGTQALYDFIDNNDGVVFLAVDEVNDPRLIGREPRFVSVNATLEVDLLGQCASETLGTRYWSGSGGQADFARGAQYSEGGEGFVVLHSVTSKGRSRIVPTLKPGAVVTTLKNTVDNVVTEHGVAELRGRTLAQRAKALIAVAHPDHREELSRQACETGVLHARHC
jgi:acyl-CoA hydrolase